MTKRLKNVWISLIVAFSMALTCALCINLNSLTAKAQSGFEIDYVPIESVEVCADSTDIHQGQSVKLSVKLMPEYAEQTVQNVSYKITGGAALSYIEGNVLYIKEDAAIGGIITVAAVADNVDSFNKLTLKVVETAVESVKIVNKQTALMQGSTLQLETQVSPDNATNKKILYALLSGYEYATVSPEGLIRVKENLPAGDLKIAVRVLSLSDVTKYDVIELGLYVPTRSLSLTVNNCQPRPIETVMLLPVIDSKATITVPQYTIISGAEYVKELNGNALTIADRVTDFSPSIIIRADRDGLTAELKINIYIPATEISVTADKQSIKQGEMLKLVNQVVPANATLTNLKYFLADASDKYASVSEDGILTAKIFPESSNVTIDVYAQIDGVVSSSFTITIEKPGLILSADNYFPESSDTFADTVILTPSIGGVVQTSGIDYVVKSGGEFINGNISGNAIAIKSGITAYNPQIVLNAKSSGFESGDIIINIKILAQSLQFANESITEVEQQRSYLFNCGILPFNATLVNEKVSYKLNVDADIAEVNDRGELSVKASAPIGQQIIITAKGPDGTIATHTVKVKTVYATALEISSVIKADGTELYSDNSAIPGDILTFNAVFPEPFNVTNSQKVYSLTLISGDIDIAAVDGNTVVVDSHITKSLPEFVVRVISEQNGEIIYKDYCVTVYIPVTNVELSAKTENVNEGARVNIDSILNTVIYPNNSSVRTAEYEIVKGSSYARVDGNDIIIYEDLPVGDLTFKIRAVADGIIGNEVEFGIYVKTKNLTVTASNYSPISKISSGEEITLTSVTDKRATLNAPEFIITSGAEYIDGNYKNGSKIGATFKVCRNLTAVGVNGAIKITAVQDGITYNLDDIVVYVPVESISLSLPETVNRDSYIKLIPVYNGIANAYVSTPGYSVSVITGNAELTGDTLYIGKTLTTGAVISVSFKSNESGALEVRNNITVNALNDSFEAVFGVPAVYPSSFSIVYGNVVKSGKSNVKITEVMQIEEGGYTDIVVRYNGQSLADFGIDNCTLEFVSGSGYVSYSYPSNGTIRIRVNSGVAGTNNIRYRIKIIDGTSVYSSEIQQLNVFKKYTSTSLTQTSITAKDTQLSVNWGTGASSVQDLKFNTSVSGSGCILTSSGKFTVTSASATYNPVVKYTAVQYYNGERYEIDASATLNLHRIELDLQGGSGNSYVIAVSNLTALASIPEKTGYVFQGYYTTAGGGTQYYSSNGTVVCGYPTYSATKLYAHWSPVTYKLEVYINKDGGTSYYGYINYVYDTSNTYTAPSVDGYDFACWKDFGENNISNDKTLTIYNACTKNGDVLKYVAYYNKKSSSCVADGTLITLADGSMKPVEDLDGSELLLVWNLYTGSYDVAPSLFIDSHGVTEYEVIHLYFSDGTEVKVIDEHGFWDFDLNKYVFLDNQAKEYIGHWFNKQGCLTENEQTWLRVQLTDVVIEREITNAWSPVTFRHLCYYVNGMLSMPAKTEGFINIFDVDAETMQIDQTAMQSDLEEYGLFTYDEFYEIAPIPKLVFEAFGGQYLKVSIGKGLITWDDIFSLIQSYAKFFN